jgi:hypothetical protein
MDYNVNEYPVPYLFPQKFQFRNLLTACQNLLILLEEHVVDERSQLTINDTSDTSEKTINFT